MKYIYEFGLQHWIQCWWWWVVANWPGAGNPIQGHSGCGVSWTCYSRADDAFFLNVRIAIGITEC